MITRQQNVGTLKKLSHSVINNGPRNICRKHKEAGYVARCGQRVTLNNNDNYSEMPNLGTKTQYLNAELHSTFCDFY